MLDPEQALSRSSLYDGVKSVLRDDQAEALLKSALYIIKDLSLIP
jgi:hypothetical protein